MKGRAQRVIGHGWRSVWALALIFGILAGALAATAGADTYGLRLGGDTRRALATPTDVQGVAYVPLGTLVRQWGGAVDLRPAWVQFELNGATVLGGINDTQITAGDQRFGLVHPLIRRDDEVLIATADLPRLVASGFGASLEGAEPRPDLPAVPPARPVVDLAPADPTALEEDAASLLAPMPAPADPIQETEPDDAAPQAGDTEAPAAETAPAPATTALRRVLIDPGHGGTDTGTASAGGITEKDLTLQLAQKLEALLRQRGGLEVGLTRDADRPLSLRERTALAGTVPGTLLISLHAGASHAPQAHGIDVFHPAPPADAAARGLRRAADAAPDVSQESRYYAEAIAQGLATGTEAPGRGVREARLLLFQNLAAPAVLVEVGHLTNPAEAALLAQDAYQDRIAAGIADGLADALARMAAGQGARP